MRGRPGCRRRRARASGLLPVGPPWLARRLPSRRTGAWLDVPLVPWRVQCPVRVCAALAAGPGDWGRCRLLCPSRAPLPAPALPALRVAGRPVRVFLTLARRYAIQGGLCVPRARSGCPSGIPRVPFACVCARAPAASAPFPPPRVGVARQPRVVPVQSASRAVPCGPRPSALPASAPCAVLLAWGGERPGPFPPIPSSGSCAPPWAGLCVRSRPAPGGWGRGGRPVCRPPSGARPGGLEGRGVPLPRSVPLPPLGGHQSRCHQRRSVHGGRRCHTVPVHVRVLTPYAVRGMPMCAGAGLPACPGHRGSRQVAVWGPVAHGPNGAPPRVPPPSLGGRGACSPGPAGGLKGRRPLGLPQASRGLERGEEGGGRGVAPLFLAAPLRSPGPVPRRLRGGGLRSRPRPPPTAGGTAPRVPPCRVLGRGCLASPGAGRGLAGHWWVSLLGGGGGRRAAPLRGHGWGAPGGGGGGSLCLGPSLCLPRAGTKAGHIGVAKPMEGVAPILQRLVSACRRPDAVRGVPLRAGAGLQACRSYCGSGRAADWGARGVRAQWRSSPGAAALWGGGSGAGGAGPESASLASGCPWVGGGRGGRGGVRAGAPCCPPSVPWCFPPGAVGGWLDGLGPGPLSGRSVRGLAFGGGGGRGTGGWAPIPGMGARWGGIPGHWPAVPSCLPSGHWASRCGAGPQPRPPRSPRRRCLVAWHRRGGEWGGAAGAGGGGPGQRPVVSGMRVSGAPLSRASACLWPPPSPRPGAARILPWCGQRGGWGGHSGSGAPGLPGRSPAPLVRSQPPCVRRLGSGAGPAGRRTIATGRGRHLRRRLRWGWGCGGGGFLGR